MKLTPDPRKADSLFLYYLFSGPEVSAQIRGQAIGSSVPGFNLGQLRTIHFRLPPLEEQRAIAAILGALDDKIELNRRMNQTLEAMAQALFESRFPGAEGDGWTGTTMDRMCDLVRQTVDPQGTPMQAFEHYSLPAFDDGQRPVCELGASIKSIKMVVLKESVLLSKLNPYIPRVWMPSVKEGGQAIASTEFLVLLPREPVSRSYLYALLRSRLFSMAFASLVTGTTGSHQRVAPDSMLSMPALIPPALQIRAFEEQARPLYDRVQANRDESETLAELRDTLLPKLLSGELRVREAEKELALA